MTYDASNRKDIRLAEKRAQLLERERIEFLTVAMRTIQGRRFFYNILEFCHIFNDPFTGNALHEAYAKGERNVGLKLYSDIVNFCPDEFVAMMREAQVQEIPDERSPREPDDTDADTALGQFA